MSATIAQRRPTALTDIISALDHPKIFAPHFRDASWQPWRVFLKALFAIPMDDDELEFYRRHTERTAEPMEPFREVALVVGRRGGKSRILALVAVYLATFRDYAPFLGAGEIATVAIIATNRLQARTIFRYVMGLLREVPALAQMIKEGRDSRVPPSIDHGPGAHDDIANAALGALLLVGTRAPMQINPAVLEQLRALGPRRHAY